ncbi:MAG: ABC transporter ATP-binding protein [Peptostreptococcaceae bacterium]|nr:ABC transporter ATP-binding protein [Peptostreptococcaceae bacterium]
MDKAVEVKNVSISFNLGKEKILSVKEYIIKLVKKELFFEEFKALDDISFDIKKGEVFGIVGLNGAGKSTLLKIIAGVMKPDKGTVKTFGSIAPLIELGAGFDMELTAYENIFLNGAVLGYSKQFMKSKLNEIIDFSELYDFIDVPIKNFSSGMVARLGFSIATIVEPNILIVDEILSVGDFKFQEKCNERINNMIENGTTIIIVSHSIEQIEEICDRALLIEHGKIIKLGDAKTVCEYFKNN